MRNVHECDAIFAYLVQILDAFRIPSSLKDLRRTLCPFEGRTIKPADTGLLYA